jgi:hypothetical protein
VHSVTQFESSLSVKPIGDKYPGQYRITNGTNNNVIITWLKELKLYGKTSADNFLPDLFFKLTKEQIQDALRIWWNTDGFVSVHKNGSPYVGIALISQDLVKGIQELLLRLGIHSTIKQQIPAIYKNTDKKVYKLSVEGIDSINRFYEKIKTYKLNKYIEVLKDDYLTTIKNADIIYDRIISIEILPEQDTTAVEMEAPHNTFLVDGLVTHNSTTMANIMMSKLAMSPHFRQLYISPSVDQTKIFSGDRVAPVIESSPLIKRHYVNSNVSQNVFTKRFLNGSTLYLRYALQSADRLRGLSTDINYYDECYHPDTEVLTDDGWKLFTDPDIKTCKFATVAPNGSMEYQTASRFIEKEYKGKLIELSGRSFKLLVTPGHNLYISQDLNTGSYRNNKNGYFLQTAENVKDMPFKMLSAAKYATSEKDTITLKGFTTDKKPDGSLYNEPKTFKSETFKLEPFMVFMGWYLSEGHTSSKSAQIFISQKEGSEAQEIRDCLETLEIDFGEFINNNGVISFYFNNRVLRDYLRKLGNSFNKYIPKALLEKTKYLALLLDSLYKGDAIKTGGHYELNTASRKLADTVQIAWFYLNRKSTIRPITEQNDTVMYRVRPLALNYQIFSNSWTCNESKIQEVDYEGNVYCATVPNGTLVVRHKEEKTPVICGNCQDLNIDIVPIINQSMSRSLIKKTVFSGTPKRTKGTLAEIWYRSTMYEWFSKCEHCSKWNFLDQKNIGLHGVICRYCGEHLDTTNGQWASTGDPNSRTKGFRVNLLMFASAPWVDWQVDVIDYRKTCSSDAIFYNEVLGLEYDDGVQPITITDLRRCCTGGPMLEDPTSVDLSSTQTTIGLDYGPVNSNKSKTVVSVIQRRGEKTKVMYLKRYKGHEADYSYIHDDIPRLYTKWRAAVIGADAGLGDGPNSEIRGRIGQPERLIAFRHSGSQRARAKWNQKSNEYTLNRNMVMTNLFRKIKNQQMEFPRWEDFEPFADDFLNIIIEYDDHAGTYKYVNTGPDDGLHSILFGELALQLLTARDTMMD